VNSDLRYILEWVRVNLQNTAKFMVLLIYKTYLLGRLPSLFLGDLIPLSRMKGKELWCFINYDLSWGDYVSTVCRKIYEALVTIFVVGM
jgi:hypothetical protein